MHCSTALRWLTWAFLGGCVGHAPKNVDDTPASPVTPVAAKPIEPPAIVAAPAEPPAIPQPDDGPVAPVGEAKPSEIPSTRPRTIEAARLHLLAIAENADTSSLAALADTKFGLAFVYRSEGKRVRRSKLPLDRTRLGAMFGDHKPWRAQMYVSALTEGIEPTDLKVDPARLTVAFAPGGYFGIDFVFKQSGEALVLTEISAWDVEP